MVKALHGVARLNPTAARVPTARSDHSQVQTQAISLLDSVIDGFERFRSEEGRTRRDRFFGNGTDDANVPDFGARHSLGLHFLEFVSDSVKVHVAVHPVPECSGAGFQGRVLKQGRRRFAPRRRAGVGNDELDEFPALKEAVPDVVALAGRNPQAHRTAQLPVAAGEQGGVVWQRHHVIRVAMDVEDRHASLGQRGEAVNRIM